MTDLTAAEARAFNRDLDAYQREVVEAELSAERIQEQVDYMLTTPEYSPYTHEHLFEAFAEAETADMLVAAACLKGAVEAKLNDNLANHLALCAIKRIAESYWEKAALFQAEIDDKVHRDSL